MALKRGNTGRDPFERVEINVYDISTKQIIFTGGQCDAATFLNITLENVRSALKQKSKVKNKYAIRFKRQNKTQ